MDIEPKTPAQEEHERTGQRLDKIEARMAGVPQSLRRYGQRYGTDLYTIISTRKKFPR